MGTDFNAYELESHIMYFDINNQYGAAMSEYLTYKYSEWYTKSENESNLFNIPHDSLEGYILEVHLEHPKEVHDLHEDLTVWTEHLTPPIPKCTIPK